MNTITKWKYDSVEGTLTNGISNSAVTKTNINTAYAFELINDETTAGRDMTVKLNAITNADHTVKAGETWSVNDLDITNVYLSNASGSNIAYRIFLIGA